jgi:hypothetical protein
MTANEKTAFYDALETKQMDQGEALVFWLSGVGKNVLQPFTDATAEKYVFYQFDERRLIDNDGDGAAAFQTKFGSESCYIYIDSRFYLQHRYNSSNDKPAVAESTDTAPERAVRPYYTGTVIDNTATDDFLKYRPVNHTTFQILCAGQDGEFSQDLTVVKFFPSGGNYDTADEDNITNFSEGRRLEDNIP